MGRTVAPARPAALSDTEALCQECGHQQDGRAVGLVERVTTAIFGVKPASPRCASFYRDDVFGDVHYCTCVNDTHGLAIAAAHHELDEEAF